MLNVGTADLKNNLSAYLRQVREGAGFIVTDHGVPVAKLCPLEDGDDASLPERLSTMVAEGFATYDFKAGPRRKHEKLDLGDNVASRYISEDRDE